MRKDLQSPRTRRWAFCVALCAILCAVALVQILLGPIVVILGYAVCQLLLIAAILTCKSRELKAVLLRLFRLAALLIPIASVILEQTRVVIYKHWAESLMARHRADAPGVDRSRYTLLPGMQLEIIDQDLRIEFKNRWALLDNWTISTRDSTWREE